jgi:hypothetical protein
MLVGDRYLRRGWGAGKAMGGSHNTKLGGKGKSCREDHT